MEQLFKICWRSNFILNLTSYSKKVRKKSIPPLPTALKSKSIFGLIDDSIGCYHGLAGHRMTVQTSLISKLRIWLSWEFEKMLEPWEEIIYNNSFSLDKEGQITESCCVNCVSIAFQRNSCGSFIHYKHFSRQGRAIHREKVILKKFILSRSAIILHTQSGNGMQSYPKYKSSIYLVIPSL